MPCSLARPLELGTVSTSSATVPGIGPIAEAAPLSLCAREPHVPADRLVAEMVPPPRFDSVRFDTYIPDPNQPSQTEAVTRPERLRGGPRRGARERRRQARRWFGLGKARPPAPAGPRGVYLDGGYGVGKTHLLASLWHATPAEPALKAFGTFVELTNLVGALGFQQTVQTLCGHRLLCIDEFELDDPGDTVLVSTLLGKLVDAGVALAATSNTLPGKLGEGRFAAGRLPARDPGPVGALPRRCASTARTTATAVCPRPRRRTPTSRSPRPRTPPRARSLDDFPHLLDHLARVHPSRYGALTDGLTRGLPDRRRPVPDQSTALRLVVLADRLYDREMPVLASGAALRPAVQRGDAERRLPQEVLPRHLPAHRAGARRQGTRGALTPPAPAVHRSMTTSPGQGSIPANPPSLFRLSSARNVKLTLQTTLQG